MRKSREADKGAKERVQGCLPVNWRRKNWATERERERRKESVQHTPYFYLYVDVFIRLKFALCPTVCLFVCLFVCLSLIFAASDKDQ